MVGDLVGVLVVRRVDVRMRDQRLDGGLRVERQERQLRVVLGLEVGLHSIPQLRHAGHVDLEGLSELCRRLQRLAGAQRRDLTDPVGFLGGSAQLGELRAHTLGRRTARLLGGLARTGGRTALGGREHVLLADPAADAGALDLREIDALFLGDLAHERRHVRRASAGRRLGGSRRAGRLGLRGHRLLRSRGLRLFLRLWLLLFLGFCLGRLGLFGLLLLVLLGLGASGASRTDHGELAADIDGVVLIGEDLQQRAGHGGRDLGVDLVRRHLEEWLVHLDGVSDGLEPRRHRALCHGLAELGHEHIFALGGAALIGALVVVIFVVRGVRLFCCRLIVLRGGVGFVFSLAVAVVLRAAGAAVVDLGELATDLNGVVFLRDDLSKRSGRRRRDFGVNLVRRDFEQRLVDLYRVSLLLEPAGNSALGDRFTQCRHLNGEGHVLTPRNLLLPVAVAPGLLAFVLTFFRQVQARWRLVAASIYDCMSSRNQPYGQCTRRGRVRPYARCFPTAHCALRIRIAPPISATKAPAHPPACADHARRGNNCPRGER